MSQRKRLGIVTKSDINNPDTWSLYTKEMCSSCYAGCCTLQVEVEAEDLIRLGYATEWDIQYDLSKLVKHLKQHGIIKRYSLRSKKFVLEQQANGACLFLNINQQCSVYEKRPNVCRDHPRVASPRKGYCPYKTRE